jgi:carboxypeptidase family protein
MNCNSVSASRVGWFVILPLLALGLGCGGSKQATTTEEKPAAEGAVYQPTGEEGSVTGSIKFEGEAPKFKAIAMDADAVCASKHSGPVFPEAVVANKNGTLRNVFVYVKSGLEGKNFAVPDQPVVLDQNGCMYVPHVIGIQARQSFKVITSDNTTHNIHPMPKVNREWNISQAPGADAIMQAFSRPEVSIPVKCNQHPWMRAYINVVSHPFYAVSGEDGTFTLKGLPPGKYTIEAVQEEYGGMTQDVTVAAKQPTTADFTFHAKQAYHPSSLQQMPAMALACCGGSEEK